MGVDGINKFLKDKYPNVYTQVHLSKFAFKRVPFDISSYIYTYISAYGKEKWLNGIISLIYLFRKNAVNVIPIFDGKAPPEKDEERADRKESRDKTDTNLLELKLSLESYKNTGVKNEVLIKAMKTIIIKDHNTALRLGKHKRLLRPSKNEEKDLEDIDIEAIQEYIDKKEKNIFDITTEDIDKLKQLLSIFKIPFIQAPDEAEALGCYMVNSGHADAIISMDSDCMAYKTPVIINDIDMKTGYCRVIYFKNLLEELEFKDPEQVTTLCILLGNDYNRHSKNIVGIGPVNAHKLIVKYLDYESIKKHEKKFNMTDDDGLIFNRCKELFNLQYPNIKPNMYWDLNINIPDVLTFLKTNNLYYNENKIKELWNPPKITFEEPESEVEILTDGIENL